MRKSKILLFAFASLTAAAQAPQWDLGKVVAVEEVSVPAKVPDPSCFAIPKGATRPARCLASNLRAQQYWRVTVEVGNRRFVVRPYRAQTLLDALNQDGADYMDPKVTAASPIEVAIISSKTVRLKTDRGQEMPAVVDSQELLPKTEAPREATGSKILLLENSDFHDLGDASPIRPASKTPVFVVLDSAENVELSRLPAVTKVPIVMTQVSATLRKFTVKDPLPAGEYVIRLEGSNQAFLFTVR